METGKTTNEGIVVKNPLQELNAQFHRDLKTDLVWLTGQSNGLHAGLNESALTKVLKPMQARLHQLAGSAGMFGLADLGQLTKHLEQQSKEWLLSGCIDAESLVLFQNKVDQLESLNYPMGNHAVLPAIHIDHEASTANRPSILLLEDDTAVGNALSLMLENFGYSVRWFSHAKDAYKGISEQAPDLIIVDLMLIDDNDDGIVHARRMRELSQAPIFVISSQYDFDTQMRAVKVGADGFFSKPLNMSLLETSLQRELSGKPNEPYRVLLVHESLERCQELQTFFINTMVMLKYCSDEHDVIALLANFKPEMLLLSTQMPRCKGPDLARLIRFHCDGIQVPITFLCPKPQCANEAEALLESGDDYLVEPVNHSVISKAVTSRAHRARMLTNTLAQDSLTGLLKHAEIKDQLSLDIERALRHQKALSLVMIDIDHFKSINDQYGHPAGDNVIRALSNLLRQRLRKIDSLGRYGGEEFLAVLPDCNIDHAIRLINELRVHFEKLAFFGINNVFHCTLSAGICELKEGMDSNTLISLADQALYRAKDGGRNLVCISRHED